MRLTLVACCALLACKGNSAKPKPADPAPPLRLDAGLHAPSGVDPSAMHLDDDVGGRPVTPPSTPNRPGRPIDVTLRSSPPGARVSVDGQPLGNTPGYWSGLADGHEHEFLFTLPRHAIARYRFVPVSSGVIHARLDPIAEDIDAGVPPPEVVPPRDPPLVVPAPAAPAPVAVPVPDAAGVVTPVGPQP
jgi:hypothetical protein